MTMYLDENGYSPHIVVRAGPGDVVMHVGVRSLVLINSHYLSTVGHVV